MNIIVYEQPKITQETVEKVEQLLNYATTHPESITRYHARRMTLYMHSGA